MDSETRSGSTWTMSLVFFSLFSSALARADTLAFRLPKVDGTSVSVEPKEASLTLVCFLGTECPLARLYAGRINELLELYAESSLQVFGVMSNRQDSVEDVRGYIAATNARFPILIDKQNRVADQFGATRTPEVFLLDSQLHLRYRGRIDDQYAPGVIRSKAGRLDLKIAIEELLAGKPVSVKQTKALGCIIGKIKPAKSENQTDSQLTFSNDILPILKTHCLECHRDGEIGPFAMDSYDEVVGWADTMLETIDDGRMPPWHADPKYGKFANSRVMSKQAKETLREWVRSGLAEGSPVEVPVDGSHLDRDPSQRSPIDGWQLAREPDVIFPMRDRPFVVPKDGVVEYQYFVVDPQFSEDKWIRAAQVVPGSRDVVHHAIVFVRPPDGAAFQGVGWLTAYVPGQRIQTLPTGCARLIPAGSKLVFQMHYTPNGSRREDITRVGLVFEDESRVTHRVVTLMAIDQDFEIPPHSTSHRVSAELPHLPKQGALLAATPHMHFRGKSFQLQAELQDERSAQTPPEEKILLSVPRYDFNWQHTYQFQDPLPLENLKRLRFESTFDNSEHNPFNPDPSEWVTWGDQTWEEMAVAFFEVSLPRHPSNALDATIPDSLPGQTAKKQRQQKIDSYVARVLAKMDTDQNGFINRDEADIVVRRWNFWRWDLNRDDVVTREEIEQVAERLYR